MKGDGNIIIKLKFIGIGYNDKYQANISIYYDNKLIYDCITYNGILEVEVDRNNIYRIEAEFLNERINTSIIANRCEYVFIFNHILYNRRTITFLLTDYYYNLPIEKGELNFG